MGCGSLVRSLKGLLSLVSTFRKNNPSDMYVFLKQYVQLTGTLGSSLPYVHLQEKKSG